MKSSIEWLYDRFLFAGYAIPSEWKEQAKEMHKDEIMDAHIEGQREFDDYPHTQWTTDQAEDYYKKTFTK